MTTLKKEVNLSGLGIHSGTPVNIVVKPSEKQGIFFRRVDMVGTDLIPATYDNVGETKMRNTTIVILRGMNIWIRHHLSY